jgi:hypothetical protein
MFKTLPDAPCTGHWLSVKVRWIEPDSQFFGAFVSGIEFGDQSN